MALGASKVTEIRDLLSDLSDQMTLIGAEMQRLQALIAAKDESWIIDGDATTTIADAKTNIDTAADAIIVVVA